MNEQPRWPLQAVVPIIAGLAWLFMAQRGVGAFLVAGLPGMLLLSSGVALLLWSGDRRIVQFMSLGALLGILLWIPAWIAFGFFVSLGLLSVTIGAWLTAGMTSVLQTPTVAGVPEPKLSPALAASVVFDDALLAGMQLFVPMPEGDHWRRIANEVDATLENFHDQGFEKNPVAYHLEPPALISTDSKWCTTRGITYQHISFASEYEPRVGEPGRERWLSYQANRTAHAWVLRATEPNAPWLVCVHGYQMGFPLMDLGLFRPEWLQKKLGFNLVIPTLPLHGYRKVGRLSGDGYLAGDVLDTLHAEAQAIWDLRRILSWVRTQGDGPISVYGISLGGYTAALLSGLDSKLHTVVSGVPVTDFAELLELHSPTFVVQAQKSVGLSIEKMQRTYRVVSPFCVTPTPPVEQRVLFAGISDRLAPAQHIHDLWRHWQEPQIFWYQGAHISFMWDRSVVQFLDGAFRRCGLLDTR